MTAINTQEKEVEITINEFLKNMNIDPDNINVWILKNNLAVILKEKDCESDVRPKLRQVRSFQN